MFPVNQTECDVAAKAINSRHAKLNQFPFSMHLIT